MKKRLIAVLLLMGMLLTSAACASGMDASDGADTASSAEISTTAAETSDPYEDGLGEYDYQGADFHMYSHMNQHIHHAINTDEETGDVLNDAVYRRNRTVESRFNFTFSEVIDTDNNIVKNAVLAGDKSINMANLHASTVVNFAAEGLLTAISELNAIDLDKAYWDKEMTQTVSVAGHQYFAFGDYNLAIYDFIHLLLFNKKLAESYGVEDLYAMVKDGTWTFDAFEKIISSMTKDVDGNGIYDVNDSYGFVSSPKQVLPCFWISAGLRTIDKDEEDKLYFNIPGNDKFFECIDRTFEMIYDGGGWFKNTSSSNIPKESYTLFQGDRALFMNVTSFYASELRAMDADFGIIPYPKWDESQDIYYSRIESCQTSAVPVTSPDPQMAGVILEALSCESAKSVIPAYYDLTLQGKIARDNESSEMLDIIFGNRVFDWGDAIWFGILRDGVFSKMFKENDRDISSKLAAMETTVNEQIKTTVDTFAKLG